MIHQPSCHHYPQGEVDWPFHIGPTGNETPHPSFSKASSAAIKYGGLRQWTLHIGP